MSVRSGIFMAVIDSTPVSVAGLQRWWRRPMVVLAGLTLLAAVLRFFRLSTPCLWGDEAEVYWRTSGTFGQMLDVLRTDGFTPLHYEMHWAIAHLLGFKPTPVVLRFVSASCGVLTVPAVYFLARQLVDRSTALMAAALTTCSAYLLYFSRDAKMYAEVWLMVTLLVACLLWWFQKPTWTRWLCWVAAGAAAVGLQMTAAVVVGLSLLLVLTQGKMHWRRGLAWLAGVVVVMAGPAGYFGLFNAFTDKAGDNWQKDSGLDWVRYYVDGWEGPEMMRLTGSAYAVGWEWPKSDDVGIPKLPDWSWRHPVDFELTVGVRLYLWVRHAPFVAFMVVAIVNLAVILALGVIPWPRQWRRIEGPTSRPRWLSLLWVLLWLSVPIYGFYCVSKTGFALPSDLLNVAGDWIRFQNHPLTWSVLLGILICGSSIAGLLFRQTREAVLRAMATAVVVLIVTGLLQIMGMVMRPLAVAAAASGHPWHPLWVPRYMGFVIPAVMIAMATLLMRLPTVYLRRTAIAAVLAVNLFVGERRTFQRSEPPTDLIAADDFAAANAPHQTLVWFTNPQGGKGPGDGNIDSESGRYYMQMLADKQPMSPVRFRGLTGEFPMESGTPGTFIPSLSVRNKKLATIIVWDRLDDRWYAPPGSSKGLAATTDTLLPKLPGWRLKSEQSFDITTFWSGRPDYQMRRREYVRD